jgi:3-oxoacyl-[acyl-carrier protein] reductase
MSANLFEGQVCVVTGGGRGIGAAACKIFSDMGAKIVVTDRDEEPTMTMAEEINRMGGDAIGVPGDVTDPAFPEVLMKETIDKYGKINVLVNNAGYTWDGMAHKMSDEQFQAMLDVHLTAPFRLIRAAAPYMRDVAKAEIAEHGSPQQNRAIINISSTSGLHGNVGQISYAAGKAGILGMTKTIAKEWGPFGIRCNAVAFGFIATRLTGAKEDGESMVVDGKEVSLGIPDGMRGRAHTGNPLGRPGEPHEGAGGIVMMASPLASYVNGHCLEVTGGSGI